MNTIHQHATIAQQLYSACICTIHAVHLVISHARTRRRIPHTSPTPVLLRRYISNRLIDWLRNTVYHLNVHVTKLAVRMIQGRLNPGILDFASWEMLGGRWTSLTRGAFWDPCVKMRLRQGLCPGPRWGSLPHSHRPSSWISGRGTGKGEWKGLRTKKERNGRREGMKIRGQFASLALGG